MVEISGQPCPDVDNCGSSDAYSWNTEKEVGKCFSCDLRTSQYNGKLYGKCGPRGIRRVLGEVEDMTTKEDPFDVLDDVSATTTKVGRFEGIRGIKSSTMGTYEVKTYDDMPWKARKSGESGKSKEIHFTYPNGTGKYRRLDLDKDHEAHFSKGPGVLNEFFGMNLFPAGCSKRLTIVEGEFDALAAHQMLTSGSYINPVVSLPNATPNGKIWKTCEKWLSSFDQIILSLDSDGKADGVAEVLFDLFPDKVYMMNHGDFKDANDFLMAGEGQAYKSAWWAARKFSPAGFTASKEDWGSALDEEDPYDYTETSIDAFNKVARGLVKGGLTIVKAPPGTGKSSFLRMLQHDLVINHKKPVSALMMEEMKSTTGRAMATYELGINVMTREDAEENGVTETQVKEALMKVVADEKFVSFDINPQDPIQDCLKQCKYAVSVYGAEYIFIDHLQRLAYLSGTEGATAALTELGVKLTEFAKRKAVGIICISHVNSDGRTKYASSIEEEAIVVIEMERDKNSDDEDEKNTTYLNITKNRPFALTGSAGALIYDGDTTMVSERKYNEGVPVMDRGKDPFDV
jgi:KaiC/GvpD/RAD55 family RecA-like ATPase